VESGKDIEEPNNANHLGIDPSARAVRSTVQTSTRSGTTLDLLSGAPLGGVVPSEPWEAAMRESGKDRRAERGPSLRNSVEEHADAQHVVFDFTGLDQPDVCDLSLILTARLQSAPTDSVWVRSLPSQTARILRILRLDHLFRTYPVGSDDLN
jgi:anti-anti-sigma regulatory factor